MFTDNKFIIPKTITGDKQYMESDGIGPDEVNKKAEIGFCYVGDATTGTTPISVSATTWTVLTNDGASSYSLCTYLPYGTSSDIFNTTSNQFEWDDGGLALGDMVDIRFTGEVTTSTSNQDVIIELFMAQGSGNDYQVLLFEQTYKTAGAHRFAVCGDVYMGDTDTLNYPAQFKIYSDASCTAEVEGSYVKVIKRSSSY